MLLLLSHLITLIPGAWQTRRAFCTRKQQLSSGGSTGWLVKTYSNNAATFYADVASIMASLCAFHFSGFHLCVSKIRSMIISPWRKFQVACPMDESCAFNISLINVSFQQFILISPMLLHQWITTTIIIIIRQLQPEWRRTSVDLLETVPHQWGIGERESKAMENNEKAYHQMASANLISMQLAKKA